METASTELIARNARNWKPRQRRKTRVQLTQCTQAPDPAPQRTVQHVYAPMAGASYWTLLFP
jgi:hypothetical protein